mgnify:FL=1
MNDNIKKLLGTYGKDTSNIQTQLELAKSYYDLGQYASAVSYLNRISEKSDDSDIIYESLCLAAQCFYFQGERETHTRVCLYHAISVDSSRPEAYYFLCRSFEITEPFFFSKFISSL